MGWPCIFLPEVVQKWERHKIKGIILTCIFSFLILINTYLKIFLDKLYNFFLIF